LARFDSGIAFVGEETAPTDVAGTRWIVDAIDGTQSFVRGLPFSTVQIALVEKDRPLLGVIANISTGEMFHARLGGGAWAGKRPLKVSSRRRANAFLGFESQLISDRSQDLRNQVEREGMYIIKTLTAGFEYTLVARGAIEARVTVERFGGIWDHAAGLSLVVEAGGEVGYLGENCTLTGDIVVGQRDIVEAISSMYRGSC
jgi:myo-inositol-1(or 4)-monophosphatase